MSVQDARELVPYLREETGDLLRSIIFFDGQFHEVVYVRDDLEDRYDEDERDAVVASLIDEAITRERNEELFVHGRLNCIVRYFDSAIELHVIHDEHSGTSVAFDLGVSPPLQGLIENVLDRMGHSSRDERSDG